MQPAARMTPSTAAVSSSSTTLVLGSRLCITAHNTGEQHALLSQIEKQICTECSQSQHIKRREWRIRGKNSQEMVIVRKVLITLK